ncbi:permease [Gordonia sp. X0973]|uniref:permease n=1 Tax=Gordonia sp. X0973 TaxID=2742602 RepID=UPI000F54368D|nr:permease [Gordonia sp. X0973]QKT08660.1 permease [Gordonia sp. X0973]
MILVLLLAVALLVALPFNARLNADQKVATAGTVFAGVFLQAVPFLVLGTLVSGAIATWVTPSMVARVLPRNTAAAIGVGGVAGALLPGCECASVPISARMMDRGVPQAAALAFLLSAPAINPVVLISTAVAFPGEPRMVLARFTASLLTALVMGGLWARFGDPSIIVRRAIAHDEVHGSPRGWSGFAEAMRHDFLESAGYLAMGALAVALMHVLVPAWMFERLSGQILLGILLMAALAVILAVCSEADAFVAASLSMLPLVPRLVFLVVGPVVDLKLIAMQTGAFGARFATRFSTATLAVAVVVATATGALILGWR